MADTPATTANCANCAKSQSDPSINLKRCTKCHTAKYCSRECQKINWKVHKTICARIAMSATSHSSSQPANAGDAPPDASPSSRDPDEDGGNVKGLAVAIDKPFHRLHNKTWLHDRPERDVFKLLIDTYRWRVEEDRQGGEVHPDSIYGGSADGRRGFGRFLRLAEKRAGLLPSWWSQDKVAECTDFGLTGGWSSLVAALNERDVIEHYGSAVMPAQLRIFGKQVYQIRLKIQTGPCMLGFLMVMEDHDMPIIRFKELS